MLHQRIKFIFIFFMVKSTLASQRLFAQEKSAIFSGTIKGRVMDSILNYYPQSATVAVYFKSTDKLISYTLTNYLGEFQIKNLPADSALTLRVSVIGYQTQLNHFKIDAQSPTINTGIIYLQKDEKLLDEIVVKPPPVRMHGDTLEFNAAAFELEKNAVAEDLLKKLPGVIVWGDGTITVNGRQISKLLVDGKPFFGDAQIATQNIPKDAIDKVQVYQEFINPFNPYDSITAINIKLRKNFHSGFFGNLYAGKGSQNTSENGASSNFFNGRNQFSLAGQSNNINKSGNDLNTLLKNSTFKGTGVRVEYQPNFTLPGENKQVSGGSLFSHDFIKDFNQYKQSRITVNAFYNDTKNTTLRSSQTYTRIQDSTIEQNNNSSGFDHEKNIDLKGRYNWKNNRDSFMLEGNYRFNKLNGVKSWTTELLNEKAALLSNGAMHDTNKTVLHDFSFYAKYNHTGYNDPTAHKLIQWGLEYSINPNQKNEDRKLYTNFKAGVPSLPNSYDRKYQNKADNLVQKYSFSIGDLSQLFFGKRRVLGSNIQFENEGVFKTRHENYLIGDWDAAGNVYKANTTLSRNGQFTLFDETVGFRLSRNFMKIFPNRFQKGVDLAIYPKIQFFGQQYQANNSLLNFTDNYKNFIPAVDVSFLNMQYGEHINQFTLRYNSFFKYPNLEQKVPVTDSADIFEIRFGNLQLKPQKNSELSFHFRHENFSASTINYGASIVAGTASNAFADSIIIDDIGRYNYHTVNLNNNKYLTTHFFFNKVFSKNMHQFQLNVGADINAQRSPGYLYFKSVPDFEKKTFSTLALIDTIKLYYSFKNLIACNLSQSVNSYRTQISGALNSSYKNVELVTQLGIAVNAFKNISITSNISRYAYAFSGDSRHYVIWNASLSQRLFKASNLELKLSALDLLNQNKGIINSRNSYAYTKGYVNLLHQYFMVTLSYFPRKFGKQKK